MYFRKGSINCNFKIRYILKEAFAVVPFRIRPSTITTTLGQGFQFKRGLLFTRFVIAKGSFHASSKCFRLIIIILQQIFILIRFDIE